MAKTMKQYGMLKELLLPIREYSCTYEPAGKYTIEDVL
jgi:hypothetical protein